MNKKRKIQLIIIVIFIILLTAFSIYQIGHTIYDYIDKSNKSSQIVDDFNEIYAKDGNQIILFASPFCKWCKQFVPVLDEISKENNFNYYYLDVSALFEKDLNKILEKLEIDFSSIPYLIILKNKKLVGDQTGFHEKDETLEFLKAMGIIEGEI